MVVNYDAAALLPACLRSLRADGAVDVVVVDNASTDASAAAVAGADPDATWLPLGANRGYGAAANAAAEAFPGRDLLVCNPDLEVRPGTLAALTARLHADRRVGVVGPALVNPDGSVYPSARVFPDLVDAIGHGLLGLVAPSNPFTRRYRMLDWDHSTPGLVDWVSGACFLVRREAWDGVGGFDPAYFMYLEDVDLCWRLGRAGWKVAYEPAGEVVHVQGVSARRHPYQMLLAHHRSMWRFARRSTTGAKRLALPVVGAGLVGRFFVSALQHRLGTGATLTVER